jgi:hypothetical protein
MDTSDLASGSAAMKMASLGTSTLALPVEWRLPAGADTGLLPPVLGLLLAASTWVDQLLL